MPRRSANGIMVISRNAVVIVHLGIPHASLQGLTSEEIFRKSKNPEWDIFRDGCVGSPAYGPLF